MTETINQPDEAEQKLAEALDNVVPSYGYALVPIVGIGGSAGGIDALRLLLGALPESSDLQKFLRSGTWDTAHLLCLA